VNNLVPGIFLLAMGAILLIFGLRELTRGAGSRSWAKTTGTVISSGTAAVHSLSARGGTYWQPRISFRYAVGGREFTGSQYSASDQSVCYTEAGAQGIAERFFSGQVVDVYYRQESPEDAILSPGMGSVASCARYVVLGLVACGAAWKLLAGH